MIQHESNHNKTDLLLYYVQLGQLRPTVDVSRFNSIYMLFHLAPLLVNYD
jgi:hypothetical protein